MRGGFGGGRGGGFRGDKKTETNTDEIFQHRTRTRYLAIRHLAIPSDKYELVSGRGGFRGGRGGFRGGDRGGRSRGRVVAEAEEVTLMVKAARKLKNNQN